jgi:LysR family tcuABC transcriptional regulator
LSGHVTVGLAPSTSAVLAQPFMTAMRERYPDVRLRIVESLSGGLTAMLNARQLDLAVLFDTGSARRWSVLPLVDERLFLIGLRGMPELQDKVQTPRLRLARLGDLPLVLPSGSHGLRAIVDAAFARAGCEPRIVMEIDGLAVLMDAVRAGIGATIQPGAAIARLPKDAVTRIEIADRDARRVNMLASVSDNELAPAGLAARVVLRDVAAALVAANLWPGATLHKE